MSRSARSALILPPLSLLLILAGFAIPVMAGSPLQESAPQVPTLLETLNGLSQAVGVGVVLSFLFERISLFQNLSSEAKWWTVLGLSLALPIFAQLALQLIPIDVWAILQPYWNSLATGFVAWSSSQVVYSAFIRKSGGARTIGLK